MQLGSASRIYTRNCASRLDSGSSMRNTRGSPNHCAAHRDSWRCPPERSRLAIEKVREIEHLRGLDAPVREIG